MIFKLSEYSIRPVILLDDLFKGCSALLDTGASFPVWTGDRDMLIAVGGVSKNTEVTFGGFGGTTIGELFYLNLTQRCFLLKERMKDGRITVFCES